MEGYDICITLNDRDFAADFAARLATGFVPFYVNFHHGMMQWSFYFKTENSDDVGVAMTEALGCCFG